MIENPDRIEQFRDEIADMKLPDTAGSRERTLAGVGVGIMAVGLIVGVVAYPISHSTNNPLQQRDAMIVAVIGLIIAVIGAALFLRYSIAQFLRFWMARLSWEQTAATDRLVETLGDEEVRRSRDPRGSV